MSHESLHILADFCDVRYIWVAPVAAGLGPPKGRVLLRGLRPVQRPPLQIEQACNVEYRQDRRLRREVPEFLCEHNCAIEQIFRTCQRFGTAYIKRAPFLRISESAMIGDSVCVTPLGVFQYLHVPCFILDSTRSVDTSVSLPSSWVNFRTQAVRAAR